MSILGGAMLPHAPQFFTMPPTEDRATLQSVRMVAAEIGTNLSALRPDLWITVSNDHAQQFFHQCAPPFAFHVGGEARGEYAGRAFRFDVASDTAFAVIREMYRSGFDPAFSSTAVVDYALGIPLTHLGVTGPLLPIFVNAYLPPQPTIERCYLFGQALARAINALGVRANIIASGGMSHFPGTDRYANPSTEFDRSVLERLKAGRLKSLAGLSEADLDDTGNIELRCWAVAAGALGDRVPDRVSFDPSWHHNYASLGFWHAADKEMPPHYPSIRPDLVQITAAVHALAYDLEASARYVADPVAFCAGLHLEPGQRKALETLDTKAIVAMGVHPLVPFLAQMQVARRRGGQA
jgi:2,3-dihydroxyphenylpropionate 1,2-dioxygenase